MPVLPAVDFPRGGGEKLKKTLKHTQQRQCGKTLFQASSQDDRKRKRKSKNVPASKKKKKDGDDKKVPDVASSTVDTSPSVSCVDLLTYKTVSESLNIFGIVLAVHKDKVTFSLPGNMVGDVFVADVCDAYSEVIKQHLEGNGTEELEPLKDMFAVGSQFTCHVKRIELVGSSTKIHLTLNPKDVNHCLRSSDVKNGMVLQGAVKSQEDHGYIVDFGISGLTGFLSTKNSETFVNLKNNGQKLCVGKVLACVIEQDDNNAASHSVNVTVDPKRVMKAMITDEMDMNLNNFLPGMQVPVKIQKIYESGLVVQVWKFTGVIHKLHLNLLWDKPDDYQLKDHYVARVLYVHPLLKVLQLSLQPHLSFAYPKNIFADIGWGQMFDNAVVVDKVSSGLFLHISDDYKGFCMKHRLSDKEKISDSSLKKRFAIGTKHRALVIGWNAVDNTVLLTMKPSVVNEPVISISDVKGGDIVKCTIYEINSKGLKVKIGPSLRGLVPQVHITDAFSVSPEKRYKIDEEISCRILRVNKERKPYDLLLTHKKSLVNSPRPPVISLEEVRKGDLVDGFVVFMSENKIVLAFYNDLRGVVSEVEMRKVGILEPAAVYKLGQVVTCRVVNVRPEKSLYLSLQTEELPTVEIAKTEAVEPVAFGTLYDGKVVEKSDEGLKLSLADSDISALLPKHHLSDYPENYQQLHDMYQVGDVIKEVVGFAKWPVNIVSKKPVLVKYAKQNSWPVLQQDLKECGVIPCVVEKQLEDGSAIVQLTTGFTGLVSEHDFSSSRFPKLSKGSTLMVRPRKVNLQKKSVKLSSRLFHCWDGTSNVSLDNLEDFLIEKANILNLVRNSEASAKDLANVEVGQLVKFDISMKSDAGVTGYIAGNVQAIATVNHIRGLQCDVGDIVTGLVVNLDVENNVAELTLHQSIIKSKCSAKRPVVELDEELNGVVLDVKELYALVFLRGRAHGAFAYLPIKRHLNDLKDRRKAYKIGSTKKVVIRRITEHGTLVTLKDANYNPLLELQGMAKSEITLPLPVRRLICKAVVTEILPLQLDVMLCTQPELKGRVDITEIADDVDDGQNPLKRFQVGDKITVRILEIQEIKPRKGTDEEAVHRAECSMKPSILNAQRRVRKGRTRPNLKRGTPLLGFISQMCKDSIRLAVTPALSGTVDRINISTNIEIVRNPKSYLNVGDGFHTHILGTKHNVLKLTMTGLPELTELAECSVVNGRVVKRVKGKWLKVELPYGYKGRIAVTDLADDYDEVSDLLALIKTQKFVQGYILEIVQSTKEVQLSLRNSRFDESAQSPIVDSEVHQIHVGLTCRGFVKEVNGKSNSAIVTIGTFLCGILPLGDGMQLNKGDLITVTIVAITVRGIQLRSGKNLAKSSNLKPTEENDKKGKDPSARKRKLSASGFNNTSENENPTNSSCLSMSAKLLDEIEKRKEFPKVIKIEKKVDTFGGQIAKKKQKKSTISPTKSDTCAGRNSVELCPLLTSTTSPKMLTQNEINEAPRLEIGDKFLWDLPDEEAKQDSSSDEDESTQKNRDAKDKKKKARQVTSNEQELYKTERLLADDSRDPRTVDDFDRLVFTSPSSSIIWLKYMAYHLQNAEVEKARSVAERALKTICFREEGEKLNVWVALLNLENLYGTHESLDTIFRRALQSNEPRKIYDHLVKIYVDTQKIDEVDTLYASMLKRFKDDQEVWVNCMVFLMCHEKADAARKVLERSFKSLPQKSHVGLISRFAQLEFKYGEAERGRTMFENIVANFPRRTDLWSVYIDLMIKRGDQDVARNLVQRALASEIPQKRIRTFHSKYSNLLADVDGGGDAPPE